MNAIFAHLAGPRAPWIAFATGALSAFAFAPVGLWPLMPLAFALLAAMVAQAATWKRAGFVGWMFGVGQFAVGLNWIATAFTFQSAMPEFFGWIAVLLLSVLLAIYPALAALGGWVARRSALGLSFALAGGWGICEWLRATLLTGFSWNPVGVTLIDTPWRKALEFVGSYGLSVLTVLIGVSIWLAFSRRWKSLGGTLLLVLLPVVALAITPSNDQFFGPTIRVVQPNLPQAIKHSEDGDAIAAAKLLGPTRPPAQGEAPDIVFWPESALGRPLRDERTLGVGLALRQRDLAVSALAEDSVLVTGAVGLTSSDGQHVTGATNSVFAITPDSVIQASYDKAHLVPFGEYLPLRAILEPLGLSRLVPGDLDFTPGSGPRTLELPGGIRMGAQVCYEIIFSGKVVDRDNRPDFIFNPSNDAWFGAWGPPQHLAQARLRAVEEGLPVVRSTPTGISAVIRANGTVDKHVPLNEAGVIDTVLPMQPHVAPTLFSRFGNLIPLLLCALLIGFGVALARRTR